MGLVHLDLRLSDSIWMKFHLNSFQLIINIQFLGLSCAREDAVTREPTQSVRSINLTARKKVVDYGNMVCRDVANWSM